MPSLSEIESIARDPGGGDISTRPLINTTNIAQQANQAAQQKAEGDWRKYNLFLDNLKGVYKDVGELQAMKTASADRPYLQQQAASIFKSIADDPKKFFQGGMAEVEQQIGKLRSESTQSAQDQLFDDAHRSYLSRETALNTDENRAKVEGFFKQPLGQRKYYTLDLPSLFKPEEIAKAANGVAEHGFSNTGLSPDGKYIQTVTGKKVDQDRFNRVVDQMYYGQDANGRSIQSDVAKRFSSLPASLQQAYKQKNPDDPEKEFYTDMVKSYMAPDQIDKTEMKDDPFALQALKDKDKLSQMAIKHGYDKELLKMRLDKDEDLVRLRNTLKGKDKKDQVGALNVIVGNAVDDAIVNTKPVYDYNTKQPIHELNRDPATLKIFGYTKGSGTDKETVIPDNIMVTQDGKKVRVSFYQKDDKGNNILEGNGNPAIDEQHTAYFGIDEYKARFGKDILGVNATEKEINANDDDGDSGSSSSSSSETTVEDLRKKYKY